MLHPVELSFILCCSLLRMCSPDERVEMEKKILLEKLKRIVEKSDSTPEFNCLDSETGYVNSEMLTEVREDIQGIINDLS